MTQQRIYKPIYESIMYKAPFFQQDIELYPDSRLKVPPNFSDAVRFLFGPCSYVVLDTFVAGCPKITIRNANFMLKNTKTIDASFTVKEVSE